MKVSIIIPIYNVAPYIERCLHSVFNQSYSDIEVIVVDDCTPDGSMAIVERMICDYNAADRVKIVTHSKNGGLSAARNSGLKVAAGEYLYFLDSDDELTLDCIERLVGIVDRYGVDMAIGGVELAGEVGPDLMENYPEEECVVRGDEEVKQAAFVSRWIYVMAWNKLINRELVLREELFFYEGILHEDDDWSFRVAQVLGGVAFCREKTYVYWLRGDSIMGRVKQSDSGRMHSYNSFIIIVSRMLSYLNSRRYDDASVKFVLQYFYYSLSSLYRDGFGDMVDLKELYPYRLVALRYVFHHLKFKSFTKPLLLPKSKLQRYMLRKVCGK